MIRGSVTARLDAVVPLELRNNSGTAAVTVDAVVDTGFDGYLSLPSSLIQRLRLASLGTVLVQQSDGSIVRTETYLARVQWHGTERIVVAQEASGEPLIGMQLLLDNRVTVEVRRGGSVMIAPLA